MLIRTLDELEFNYKNSSNKTFKCSCENCKKEFEIKSKACMERKLKEDKLLCRECIFTIHIGKRSDERRKQISEKRKATNKERYGVENTWQLDKVIEMSHNRDWTERDEHARATNLRKYGTTYAGWDEKAKEKREQTLIKNYGSVKNSYKERQKKVQATNLKRRGTKTNLNEPGFREKAIQTMIEKYGRPIYSRTYIYDEMCFDSSWELAYYIWLKARGVDFVYQPQSNLKYIGNDNKEHIYHPDFLVDGQYIEIKGNQFFNEKDEPYCSITRQFWWEKYNLIKENNVLLLREKDLKNVFDFIEQVFGKNYLKSFKVKVKR